MKCGAAKRDDGILVTVAAAVKKRSVRASDRSIQTLRSDIFFVSYCTDGLIARGKAGIHTT